MRQKHRYLLDFQKRLIRTASEMPRVDSARLFSIIKENLLEFMKIRVPEEGLEGYEALRELEEVFNIWGHAVLRKFPNLCITAEDHAEGSPRGGPLVVGYHEDGESSYRVVAEWNYEPIEDESFSIIRFHIDRKSNLLQNGMTDNHLQVLVQYGYYLLADFGHFADSIKNYNKGFETMMVNKYGKSGPVPDGTLATSHLLPIDYEVKPLPADFSGVYDQLFRFPCHLNGAVGDTTIPQILYCLGVGLPYREEELDYDWQITDLWTTIYRTDSNVDVYMERADYKTFFTEAAICLKDRAKFYIEPNARDDEQNNAEFSKVLRGYGGMILTDTMGYPRPKVHAKVMIVRAVSTTSNSEEETDNVLYLRVISTGNFNSKCNKGFHDLVHVEAFRQYESKDLLKASVFADEFPQEWSFFRKIASDKALGIDADIRSNVFSTVSYGTTDVRDTLRRNIADLVKMNSLGKFICIKCNHITDPNMIATLIDAAQHGVKIFVIVRTSYAIPEFSSYHLNGETRPIEARTILGNYLEHERFYIMGTMLGVAPHPNIRHCGISSADLMTRNLSDRIEYYGTITDEFQQIQLYRLFRNMFETPTARHLGFYNYPCDNRI